MHDTNSPAKREASLPSRSAAQPAKTRPKAPGNTHAYANGDRGQKSGVNLRQQTAVAGTPGDSTNLRSTKYEKTTFTRKIDSEVHTGVADAETRDAGQTKPQFDGGLAPRLPHERDESSDSQDGQPNALMRQAHLDLERGLVDTDRGPVMDKLYEDKIRPRNGGTRDRAAPKAKKE